MIQTIVDNAGYIEAVIVLSMLVVPSIAYLKWGYRYIRRQEVLPEIERKLETFYLDSALMVMSILSVVFVLNRLENVLCVLGMWLVGPLGATSGVIIRSLLAQRMFEHAQSEASTRRNTDGKTDY